MPMSALALEKMPIIPRVMAKDESRYDRNRNSANAIAPLKWPDGLEQTT